MLVLGWVVKTNLVATPATTLKALLIEEVRPELEAVKVYPEPAKLILSPLKVTTPLTAFSVLVPESTAPLVPVPEVITRLTETVDDVTVLPYVSWIVTMGWVPNAVPAVLLVLGGVVKANLDAAPAVTLKALVVAEVRPVLEAFRVYPVPTKLILRPLNVTNPLTAFSVVVPASTALLVPVPVVIARITEAVDETTVLP